LPMEHDSVTVRNEYGKPTKAKKEDMAMMAIATTKEAAASRIEGFGESI
jgi:hypothetical protein